MQFQKNDAVLYGTQGVCEIVDITERSIDGQSAMYYVLKPAFQACATTVYVPTESQALISKMKTVLSREEAVSLIRSIPDIEPMWIDDDAARKDAFRSILSKGSRSDIIRMIKSIYVHRLSQQAKSRKLHLSDEKYMKEAESLIYGEIAYALDIPADEVVPLIHSELDGAG